MRSSDIVKLSLRGVIILGGYRPAVLVFGRCLDSNLVRTISGRFGTLWVGVATVVESFHDAVDNLFDALDPFLGLFDVL